MQRGFAGIGPAREIATDLDVISYGGGVDSFCMLLDAVARGEKPDSLVFMDVGDPKRKDPAEWPETYRHLQEVVIPYANKQGIPFYWLATGPGLKVKGAKVQIYPIRPGSKYTESLSGNFRWGAQSGGIQIPTTQSRQCTSVAKVERFQKWIVDNLPGRDVGVWIGFDASEKRRIEGKKKDPHAAKATTAMKDVGTRTQPKYPLMDRELTAAEKRIYYGDRPAVIERYGGKGLDRRACKKLIKAAGFEVPPKSACVMCPFVTDKELLTLLRQEPETFRWIEQWEKERREGPPTAANVILSMYGYQTFQLTAGRYTMLRRIKALPRSGPCKPEHSLLTESIPVDEQLQGAKGQGVAYKGRVYKRPLVDGAPDQGKIVSGPDPDGRVIWQSSQPMPPTKAMVDKAKKAGVAPELRRRKAKLLRPLKNRRAIPGGAKNLAWLMQSQWVKPDACRLTKYGEAVLRAWEQGPIDYDADDPPHWTGWTGPVTPPQRPVGWATRQAAGKNMQLGIHYKSPALRAHLQRKFPEEYACILADEERALAGDLVGVSGLTTGGRAAA